MEGLKPWRTAGLRLSNAVELKRGDKVSLGIEGLGEQHQKIVAFKA
jgi:2-keto-4-pentenoate hydratase/2-oxohepta-3-ene-1,7-dioic acid hydratase in catechol pathway